MNRTRRLLTTLAMLMACSPSVAAPAAPSQQQPWWAHAVIYEIYPRSFQDTDGDGIGDLQGVIRRLDYLAALGVDAIWLTPFYPSPNADFGYDVSDYENVAPEYGTLADWDQLVAQARARHIRVLVDLVLNHSSSEHPWFKESRSSRDNPKRDWYVWRDGRGTEPPTHWESIFGGPAWTWDAGTRQWYYHIFLPEQPDLNWTSSGLRHAMFDVVRFWLDRGASGFRLDATPYLVEDPAWPDDPNPKTGAPVGLKPYNSGRPETHQVLRELRAVLNGYPGDPVLLGESSTATIEDLAAVYGPKHDEIHLPMDFLFANVAVLDASQFKHQLDDAESKLGGEPPVLFLSNHDRSRQWSTFGDGVHDGRIAKLAAALTLTPRGTALIYYGEEIGMGNMPQDVLKAFPLGPKRPRADERDRVRTPMQWTAGPGAGFTQGHPWLPIEADAGTVNVAREQQEPDSLLGWYARLIALRRGNAALRDGEYVPLESGNPHVLAFARATATGEGALILLNTSGSVQHADITGWGGTAPRFGKVLLSSPSATGPLANRLAIAPFGVVIAAYSTSRVSSARPQYHFTAARHWINDPNGLVYRDGTYHLFYQYNPFGSRWGHMSWGHADSTDLTHWRELPVAIPEDRNGMIFSGSVVVDEHDSSGFGSLAQPPLVAVYTGSSPPPAEIQRQQLAFSNDGGLTWTQYAGNPVLDLNLRAFRDPKVFWYAPDRRWIMVAVHSDEHVVAFYESTDLKAWRHAGDFGPSGAVDGAWECPDLFELPVMNQPQETRWILKVDVFKSASLAGSGAQYFIGRFDGKSFVIDPQGAARPIDYGKDFYAAASWANIPPTDGRHLWIGWMNNHAYAQDTPTTPWRGAMTVPRSLRLRKTDDGYDLLQSPVAELARRRTQHRHLAEVALGADPQPVTLAARASAALEIDAAIAMDGAAEAGLVVRGGPDEQTVIGYEAVSRRLFVDRTRSGRDDFSAQFAGRQWAPFNLDAGLLRLRVLLDSTSVEVFAGDGERVFTEQIFPSPDSLRLAAYAHAGAATLKTLDLWDLDAPRGTP